MGDKNSITMKINKLGQVIYPALSFLIPAIIMIGALAGLEVTPFGDNSIVISDGNALYINYMGYISRVLKGEEGVLYSFTKGLGGNMMGSWGWFLLNPLFALFALADVTNYMQVFTYVSVLSFCLCGLTMYIMLADFYGRRAGNLIFSTAYALNGFLVANVFQLNFFVVIPVLPIMVMGLRRILNDKSPAIYLISLAYALLMNFYFGFMLCVASLLFFVVYFIANRDLIENKKGVVLNYIVSSLLAGALSSIVWLPALMSLKGGRLDQSVAWAISSGENMPFLDMFSKLFIGANSTSELSDGLPNIFVGIFPVFLVILFFASHSIPKKNKVSAAIILIFYLLSFYITVFNMAMHGGTVTNWFNYRDSFVFCFIVILIAAEEWKCFADEPADNLRRCLIILTISTILVFNKRFEYVTGGMALISFAILAIMLMAFYMHKKNPEKNSIRMLTMIVLRMVCIELYLNYYFSVKNIMEWQEKESEYQAVVFPVSILVDAVKGSDDGLYRMEITKQRTGISGNDPMLYGYYGVGHSGSDEKNFIRDALSELGVHGYNMRNNYGRGVSEATDGLLGIKYLISKTDVSAEKGYEKLIEIGDYSVYKNTYALPIGMIVNDEINDVSIDDEDVFENLNRTWSAMTGIEDNVFNEEENIEYSICNVTDSLSISSTEANRIVSSRDIESVSSDGIPESDTILVKGETWATRQKEPENINYIRFSFTAEKDGAIYSYNRSGVMDDFGSYPHALNYEGNYRKGDNVIGYIAMEGGYVTRYLLEEVAGRFKLAYLDSDVLSEMSKVILDRPSTIAKISNNQLNGTFASVDGQKLMFTIPYDKGWTLLVDGKKKELNKVLDLFMVAEVESGEHTYELKYIPCGLNIGEALGAISLLLTALWILKYIKK